MTGVSPKDAGERQSVAVFEQEGKHYAAPIGTESGGDYKFYSDDMLFIEDPHQLYKHWPADVWQAIDQHQVKPGMSELEADFAVGIGLLAGGRRRDGPDAELSQRREAAGDQLPRRQGDGGQSWDRRVERLQT